MADLDGTLAGEGVRGDAVAPGVLTIPSAPEAGEGGYVAGFGEGSIVIIQMQAFDSVTDDEYLWTVTGSPDWAGTGYPGPNSPTDIAIAARVVR